ncbi:MAG: hypothetical protein R3E89_07275 [Thiolinea sp.]
MPADWHSPNPIYFLSAKEPVFLVSVAPRCAGMMADADLDEVMDCVAQALEWLGAGAKTAVGYGQFNRDEAATLRHREQRAQRQQALRDQQAADQALAGLSGVARELMQHSQQARWEQDKDAFVRPGEADVWMEKLADAAEYSPAVLQHLQRLFEQYYPGLLADPDQMNLKKKKPTFVFKDRPRALAKQFQALMNHFRKESD